MRPAILVCGNVRCLKDLDAEALCQPVRGRLAAHGLRADLFTVKCLDMCQHGPHVVVHGAHGDVDESARAPDGGVAYDQMTPSDMARLVDEHLAQGRPLTDRLHRDQPGRG